MSLFRAFSRSSKKIAEEKKLAAKSAQTIEVTEGVLMLCIMETRNISLKNSSDKPYCMIEFDKNEIVVNPATFNSSLQSWKQKVHFDVSRSSDVNLQFWIADLGSKKRKDVFLGCVKIEPIFEENKVLDKWLPLYKSNLTDKTSGEVHVTLIYKKSDSKAIGIDDFDLLKVIGKGSFGKVMQVRKKDSGRIYAMKIIRKANIIERDEVEHTLAERNVLAKIDNPFVVSLKFSFQNPDKLYLVLPFINGGELFFHLQQEGKFEETRAKLYCAELLSALEHLHEFNIIYRDLKPENILLDYAGHIALCDFGLCKLDMTKEDKTNTFCGTPEYLAPELLEGKGYSQVVDWWTLGVLLYEMLSGLPPFYSEDINEMYNRILNDELKFPADFSPEAKSILIKLLNRDPEKRLGRNGSQEIKSHPFFADIDWKKVQNREYQPPFKPSVKSDKDTSNFDEEFTKELPQDSLVADSHLSETVQQKFIGFTYVPDSNIH